jgi:pSer/pThr/pTyr-binding forkhead associated (FHA) protein
LSSSLPSAAWLEFPSGDCFYLKEGATSIGRAPNNRIIVHVDRVSRQHAAIKKEDDGTFTLMDLGSSNGTFLNGQRLTRPVTLRNGWIIEVGLQ